MALFRNLQAPITNDKAAQRFQDTQALRARQLAGQAPVGGQVAPQQVAAAGAQLTAQTGQSNLQEQQRQAQLGRAQTGQQVQTKQMASQQRAFDLGQTVQDKRQELDQKLFELNQDAADQEQNSRINFEQNVANRKYLNEMELADWTVQNAQDEQEFADRMQDLEQAHKRKAELIDAAYSTKLKDLERKEQVASQDRAQQYKKEIADLKQRWEMEKRRRAAEAANRQAMKQTMGTVLGVGLAAAATYFSGGAAAPAAPLIVAGTQAAVNET